MYSARFRELDGLRGIAAFAVVLLHFTVVFEEIFPATSLWAYTSRTVDLAFSSSF